MNYFQLSQRWEVIIWKSHLCYFTKWTGVIRVRDWCYCTGEERGKKTIPCSRASIIALRSYSSLVPVLFNSRWHSTTDCVHYWWNRKIKTDKVSTAFLLINLDISIQSALDNSNRIKFDLSWIISCDLPFEFFHITLRYDLYSKLEMYCFIFTWLLYSGIKFD